MRSNKHVVSAFFCCFVWVKNVYFNLNRFNAQHTLKSITYYTYNDQAKKKKCLNIEIDLASSCVSSLALTISLWNSDQKCMMHVKWSRKKQRNEKRDYRFGQFYGENRRVLVFFISASKYFFLVDSIFVRFLLNLKKIVTWLTGQFKISINDTSLFFRALLLKNVQFHSHGDLFCISFKSEENRNGFIASLQKSAP